MASKDHNTPSGSDGKPPSGNDDKADDDGPGSSAKPGPGNMGTSEKESKKHEKQKKEEFPWPLPEHFHPPLGDGTYRLSITYVPNTQQR